jgi:hypothetical protein
VGAKPAKGADVVFDGSRKMLDKNWTYWKGPRFASALPIKWKIVDDPVDDGTCVSTFDPAAKGGKYGAADIVTKKAYRDFRLHIEFLITKRGGNSGVYLQNRFEIQILDGDKTKHGMGAVINESESPTTPTTVLESGTPTTSCFVRPALWTGSGWSNRWSRCTSMARRCTPT